MNNKGTSRFFEFSLPNNVALLCCFAFFCINSIYAQLVDPSLFIATLRFDGTDFLDGGETNYPMSYRFNTTQDGNNNGVIDVEDNLEDYVRFAISDNVYGTGKTGLANRGPNNQLPALYFHFKRENNYDVYEYWLYYPDNDYVNDHEHDWEKYFVYAQGTTPIYVFISNHSSFNGYSWCDISHDDEHPLIGVDGGSHAMKTGNEDGVEIRYNGEIHANSGTLNFGDNLTFPWTIYSNDAGILNAVSYLPSPDVFFGGDPSYFTNSDEFGSDSPAPWVRDEWDNPPEPHIANLGPDRAICQGTSITLNAGSGFNSYFWSTGPSTQSITVNSTGTYYVEVTDNNGCINTDTVHITVNPLYPINLGNDVTIIAGSNFTLDAGSGYDSYLWNDGSTNQSFLINANETGAGTHLYFVNTIDSIGCTDSDSILVTVDFATSVDSPDKKTAMFVYPNPASGIVNISNELLNISSVEIKNSYGEIVYTESVVPFSGINISRLSKGVYFVEVKTENESFLNKLIIQ